MQKKRERKRSGREAVQTRETGPSFIQEWISLLGRMLGKLQGRLCDSTWF